MKCSFCGKGRTEVAFIITGPEVFICSGCVILCVDLLQDEGAIEINVGFRECIEKPVRDTLMVLKGKFTSDPMAG